MTPDRWWETPEYKAAWEAYCEWVRQFARPMGSPRPYRLSEHTEDFEEYWGQALNEYPRTYR